MARKKQPEHGGAREGAGRPSLAEKDARVQIAVQLHPKSLKELDRRREPLGLSRGRMIENLLGLELE